MDSTYILTALLVVSGFLYGACWYFCYSCKEERRYSVPGRTEDERQLVNSTAGNGNSLLPHW